jgi:hypothetical protein
MTIRKAHAAYATVERLGLTIRIDRPDLPNLSLIGQFVTQHLEALSNADWGVPSRWRNSATDGEFQISRAAGFAQMKVQLSRSNTQIAALNSPIDTSAWQSNSGNSGCISLSIRITRNVAPSDNLLENTMIQLAIKVRSSSIYFQTA